MATDDLSLEQILDCPLPPRPEPVSRLIRSLLSIVTKSLTLRDTAETLRATDFLDRLEPLPALDEYLEQRKAAAVEHERTWDSETEELERGFHASQQDQRSRRAALQNEIQSDYKDWISAIDAAIRDLPIVKPYLEGSFAIPAAAWVSQTRATLVQLRSYAWEIGSHPQLWDIERIKEQVVVVDRERQGLQTAELARAADQALSPAMSRDFAHADDFTWIVWYGIKYDFAKGNQSETISALWASWEKSGRRSGSGLSEATIAGKCGSSDDHFRLVKVLGKHPILKAKHVQSVGKGIFALCAPESHATPTS